MKSSTLGNYFAVVKWWIKTSLVKIINEKKHLVREVDSSRNSDEWMAKIEKTLKYKSKVVGAHEERKANTDLEKWRNKNLREINKLFRKEARSCRRVFSVKNEGVLVKFVRFLSKSWSYYFTELIVFDY